MDNVLSMHFGDEANAYEAMSVLKELDDQGQIGLAAAAVVVRAEDGRIVVKDQVGEDDLEGTTYGGIVGLLIGVLGGPLGVLIGGATGLLVGSLFDMADEDDTESVLSDMSRSVRPGETVLLAEANEQSPEVVDSAIDRLGGTVLRRTVEAVQAEIAVAEDAQRAAAREARKQLREQRREQAKDKIQAKIADLKAKLHRHPAGAHAS